MLASNAGPLSKIPLACRFLAALLIAVLLAACGEPVATPEPVFVRLAGSTTMGPLAHELAETFSQQHADINVEVDDLGTQFGLEALRAGEADLAMASWLPPIPVDSVPQPAGTPDSKPGAASSDFWGQDLTPGWKRTAIARDGIAVIVHASNPVSGVGLLQLRDLFSGRTHEWRAIGGAGDLGVVEVVSREAGSGTRRAFETLVMEGLAVTPRAAVAPSSEAVVEYVSTHPAAIGYVSMAFGSPEVKILSIEGVVPTAADVARGSYALTRDLWLLTADPPPRPVAELVRFALSPVGQQIVDQHHGRIR